MFRDSALRPGQEGLQELTQGDFTLPHVMFFGGGVVIKVGDETIGAIGAAGTTVANLIMVALAPDWRISAIVSTRRI